MSGEEGFSLVEVVVAAGLLALGVAATAGALAATARGAALPDQAARAADLAENALARGRAATLYAPVADGAPPAALAPYVRDRSWALRAGEATIAVPLDAAAGPCLTTPMTLAVALVPAGAAETPRLTAAVTYRRRPCDAASPTLVLTRAAALPPPALPPGSALAVPIADPADHR